MGYTFGLVGGGGFDADALAANLRQMGVAASADEDAEALIAKVLRIRVGDPDVCLFQAALIAAALPCSYGYFSYGEAVNIGPGVKEIAKLCRMERAVLQFSGDGAELLEVVSGAWTETTRETGVLELTYEPDDDMTRFDLMDALDGLTVRATEAVHAQITLSCVGEDGETYPADGWTSIQISSITWEALEGYAYQWQDLEGRTWDQLEGMEKPESR
jgi:hypothetical protein